MHTALLSYIFHRRETRALMRRSWQKSSAWQLKISILETWPRYVKRYISSIADVHGSTNCERMSWHNEVAENNVCIVFKTSSLNRLPRPLAAGMQWMFRLRRASHSGRVVKLTAHLNFTPISILTAAFCNFLTHGTPNFNDGSWGHTTNFRLTEWGYKTTHGHKNADTLYKSVSYID
jgi:hypothetical protein